jgi:hypothetical protein
VVAAIVIVVVLLVVAVAGYAVWKSSQRAVTPGQANRALPPRQAQQPNQPGFTRLPPDARGTFTEQYRTKQGSPPPPPPGAASGKPNTFGTVYVNPTAICRLTGKQVADCTCSRCAELKKQA